MVKTKRLVAFALAILMILGSFSMTSFAWDLSKDGSTLTIHTEILREVNGEWVKTDKVEKGETVKARVHIGTDYYTNAGSLLFFYSNEFFTDAYGDQRQSLVINPYYSANYVASGQLYASETTAAINKEAQMLADGRISQDEANDYNPINIIYTFDPNGRNKMFDVNKWFCEIVLTVKDDAPAGEFGRFLAFESTASTPSYTKGYINIPKGSYQGYNEDTIRMSNWDATLDFSNDPVQLYQNLVAVSFDAGEGSFSDGASVKYMEGDAGDDLVIEEPIYYGYKFQGWLAEGETDASKVTEYPAADTSYTAVWKRVAGGDEEHTLKFRTEIHRLNEETGEYEKTDRVKRGETVKARLYVDTSYYTNAGDIIVFYNNDFFMDSYKEDVPTLLKNDADGVNHVNTSASSSAAKVDLGGSFTKTATSNDAIQRLLENGYIDTETASKNNSITIAYVFNPTKGAVLSGDEWLVEFDLVVRDTAKGQGDFYLIPSTVMNTTDGVRAFVNVPYSEEGWEEIDSIHMFDWDVDHTIESNPVTVESTITFEGEGGTFAETGEGTYVIDAEDNVYIGEKFVAPAEPTREGYAFMGWVDEDGNAAEIPATMPLYDVTFYATWSKKSNITFKFNNGEPDVTKEVISGQPFEAPEAPVMDGYEFIGWDDDTDPSKVSGLPKVYPEEDKVYTAIFEITNYPVYYYVLDPVDLQFDLVDTGTCEFGEVINAVPTTYVAPEGYTLSPAYKDLTFSTAFVDGETMPAKRVDLYYKLNANTYNAVFNPDGGVFADGTTENITVPTVYGKEIIAPADPTKKGFEFLGWDKNVGTMDAQDTTYTAVWTEALYSAKFIAEGVTVSDFPTYYGEEIDVPADPYKEGYTFTGWTPDIPATMPAENMIFTAVFEANEYNAIFKLEETDADEDAYAKIPTKYDDDIVVPATKPEKVGYEFGGWVDENGNPPTTMDAEGKIFYAVWNPKEDTKYTIETYTMATNGTYSNTPDGTPVEKTGTTDAWAEVTPNAAEGFYVDTEHPDYLVKAKIAPDGSTVLKVFYARNPVKVTFDAKGGKIATIDENGNAVELDKLELNLYYGASVIAPNDPALTGYSFKGWDPAVVNKAIEDATYNAQWTVNQYTITFDTDGGTEIGPITQDFDSDITAPADPTKTGYTFDKWVDGEGNEAEVPAKMPAENTKLTATYTPNTYDAVFDADGGEFPDGSTEQKVPTVFDQPITEPAEDPTKDGYVFDGWVDENGNAPGNMETEGGETYKPVWTPADQDVTVEIYYMDADGTYPAAADETDSVTFKTEETATYAPADVKNYTVDTEKSVLEEVVAADGSTVLKVYYALNKTTISFDVDGTVTEVEGLIGAEVPADKVPAPEKEGYTFAGWEAADGTVSENAPATFPEEDATLKADWTVKKYDVTFIVDEEVVEGYPQKVEFGGTIPVPATPSKGGYDFLGWIDEKGKTPTNYGTMPAEDLEFVAQWGNKDGIGYTLEVYKMDTEGNYPDAPTETIKFTDGVVDENRTVTYTAPEGFAIDYTKSELTGKIPATGTLVLKAYLSRNQYVLTVNVDGVVTEATYYYDEVVDTVKEPSKEGNVEFAGWVDAEGNATKVPAKMPAGDVFVKAAWTTKAGFNAGEGTFSDGTSEKDIPVEVGEAITAPSEEPKRPGYVFEGWAKESDPETPVTDFGVMDENGESFVAVWDEEGYEITFMNKKAPADGPNAPTVDVEYATGDIDYMGEIILPPEPTFDEGKTYYFVGWFDAEGKEYKAGDIYEGTTDLVLYAKYERVAIKLVPREGSTTVVERNGVMESYNTGTDVNGNPYKPVDAVPYETPDSFEDYYIYGLETLIMDAKLLNEYITVLGDGRIEVIHAASRTRVGTGSVINVYDRCGTDEITDDVLVETFYVVIFGDTNGDAGITAADASITYSEALKATSWSIPGEKDYAKYRVKAANIDNRRFITSSDGTLIEEAALGVGVIDQVLGIKIN